MSTLSNKSMRGACLAATMLLLVGCGNPAGQLDHEWTPSVAICGGIAGLGGAVRLHRAQNSLIGVQLLGEGSVTFLFFHRPNYSWVIAHSDLTSSYAWGYAAMDPQTTSIVVPQGYAETEQLVFKALIGTLTEDGKLRTIAETKHVMDKRMVLGETGRNVRMSDPGKRSGIVFGAGIVKAAEVYVPFNFDAMTFTPPNRTEHGPYVNGVFHSTDWGKSWQMEKVSEFYAGAPDICRTTENLYYFGNGALGLSVSRKSAGGSKWDGPRIISKTLGVVFAGYTVTGEGEIAHVCWEDRRHNKWRFNIDGPPIENNDIYYRRRKDSDADWSKEVLLSKGLLYCYAPTMSAEGNNVVVVWAGIRTADKQHTDMGPNDIYYVTSKDGGKTWTDPLKVTDSAKDGATSGMPQVALLNGTIHLLYTQGQRARAKEISPGLTRLGGEPWPIYYTHRPFPN